MAYTPTLLVTSGTGVDTLKAASDKINTNLNAISTEIETVRISVVEWTNSVISKESSTPPVSPSEGDRYIVKATGAGDWSGHDTEIAEYDGEDWVFTEPVIGTATVVDDETIIYVFNGMMAMNIAVQNNSRKAADSSLPLVTEELLICTLLSCGESGLGNIWKFVRLIYDIYMNSYLEA